MPILTVGGRAIRSRRETEPIMIMASMIPVARQTRKDIDQSIPLRCSQGRLIRCRARLASR